MSDALQHYVTSTGDRLAYYATSGASPGVFFLGGFRSDMTGSKATTLESYCRGRGQSFIRFDYHAHGASDGDFLEGSIGRWTHNALELFDALSTGPQILVGSSMGGWIALNIAVQRMPRVAGIIGIAAAPDFTERLMWARATPQQQATILREGSIMLPSEYGEPYPITRQLIEEARNHLLLDRVIPVTCPVRLLHGMQDPDVPWSYAFDIVSALQTNDVQTLLIKEGDHRLSGPEELHLLTFTLEKLLDKVT
ncbi:MAG: alpha/beta hydrolase [Rickettsiales bacterium]|jgi:pimeloyl-ACP methyl ester carboxylesterase|nr:alpha/beta hydrolase [Rickettsiales bacterium]